MDPSSYLLLDLLNSSSEDDSDCDFDARISTCAKNRKMWVEDHIKYKEISGEFKIYEELSAGKFCDYFRKSRSTFSELHDLIKEDIKKKNTCMRKSISSEERLAVCLRYLSTGDSFRTIAFSYRIGESTVANIITEVCDALWKHLQPKVLSEPTQETWKDIAMDFKETCQFDHCCGAIDGKHVTVKAPPNSGSDYFNYKKTFSIVLLAVADARRRFTIIDVGSNFFSLESISRSEFGKKLHNGQIPLPEEEPLTPGGLNIPYVFIGDEALPLLSNLMRVYPKDMLTKSRKIYNYRLCRARRIVENAFGVLSSRWRVYKRPLECSINIVDKIIKATCVLHNYFIEKRIDRYFNISRDRNLRQLGNNQLTPLQPNEMTYLNYSFFIREEFCRYFNTVGAVSWQDTRILNRLNAQNAST